MADPSYSARYSSDYQLTISRAAPEISDRDGITPLHGGWIWEAGQEFLTLLSSYRRGAPTPQQSRGSPEPDEDPRSDTWDLPPFQGTLWP